MTRETVNSKAHDDPSRPPGGSPKTGKVRWGIATLFGIGILINYLDRLSISVVATPISDDFGLTATQFGVVGSAFIWTYALMQIPSGILLDRLGTQWMWRAAMGIWAIASFLTAMATGLWIVIVARILLGVAEAPAIPGAMKATGSWFPLNERGLATAIFDSGTRLANVIGLPLIAFAVQMWGWREAFWLQGILSIIFLVIFWIQYREPNAKRAQGKLSDAEFRYIEDGGGNRTETKHFDLADFVYLLKQRKIWGLSIGLSGAGYVLWMLFTWLPGYLQMTYHTSIIGSGLYTAIPDILMFVSELLLGGYIADRLITRGYSADKVRRTVLVLGMLIAFLTIGAATANSPTAAIVWIGLGSIGIALVYVISNAIPALIAPEGDTGSVAAIMNCVNLVAGLISPIVTGEVVDATGDFKYAFLVGGVALLIGLLSYVFLMGRIEPIPPRDPIQSPTSNE